MNILGEDKTKRELKSVFNRGRVSKPPSPLIKLPLLALTFCLGTALRSHAADPTHERYDLSKRASEVDSLTREHPEIGFVFKDAREKVIDLEHATAAARFTRSSEESAASVPLDPGWQMEQRK